nr:hypothetical protein [Tanacetum cinerariifolium]
MVVQNQSQLGEGSAIPTNSHHTPTIILPSTQPQKTEQPRKPKRKDTQVPQPSDPIKDVPDEVVHKELGDSLVLDLENTTTTQRNKIASLKRRFKKLEKKIRSRTHRLKGLYKVSLTARVESSGNEESLGEDASKQGRIDAIDVDEEITHVIVQDEVVSNDADKEMFDVDVLDGEEVFVANHKVVVKRVNDEVNVVEEVVKVINIAKLIIDIAQDSVAGDIVSTVSAATTTKIDVDHQLAERMQAQEQEELSIAEKGCWKVCMFEVLTILEDDSVDLVSGGANEFVNVSLSNSATSSCGSIFVELIDGDKVSLFGEVLREGASLSTEVKEKEDALAISGGSRVATKMGLYATLRFMKYSLNIG